MEKLTSEYVLGQQYDVWDAHTSDGRWWVITNPVNLYSQDQIKSMDIALSFHIGLMSRMMASQPHPSARQGAWMLEVTRRLDVASESLDRAREVEDFQAVGMRLREALLTLAAKLAGLGYQTDASAADLQHGNFKAWASVCAETVAAGSSAQYLRALLKALSEKTWNYAAWLTHAARLERQLAATRAPRYKHIVVDEAQDLSSAHWMLLRAMAGQGKNDLFLAGDTHQRIYDNYVSLSSLGIEIRGRSSRLTLTYRSTHEILTAASRILGTESWDDMDDGTDTLDGYRSVLRGPQPEFHAYGSWQDELDGILRQVQEWTGGDTSIAVSVPTKKNVEQVESYLSDHGVPAGSIGPDGPRLPDAVHIGTLQRFKGLEYQRMILAGITDAAVPGQRVAADQTRQQRELMRARSLLFVAATRARDALVISWHGQPSRFLPPVS